MLKAESTIGWGPEQEATKRVIIDALTSAPLLKKPNYAKWFTLTTDASDHALGAVVSQDDGPIAYLSKTFLSAEQKWSTYEKEMFVVIYALKKFYYYFNTQQPVEIITDNAAVSWIQKQAHLTPKQARWIQLLEEFNYTIQYRLGAENKVADALS